MGGCERSDFVRFLVEQGALRFGDFRLKSGDRSPFFVNLGEIRSGLALARLGGVLAGRLAARYPGTTVLFGPAYKGIPMVTALAIEYQRLHGRDLAICYDRKEAKEHGEGGRFIGQLPGVADKVVLVDDVVSSGGTKFQAIERLERELGVRPQGVLVAVDRVRRRDREQLGGLALEAIIDLGDILSWLEAGNDSHAAALRDFYEG